MVTEALDTQRQAILHQIGRRVIQSIQFYPDGTVSRVDYALDPPRPRVIHLRAPPVPLFPKPPTLARRP